MKTKLSKEEIRILTEFRKLDEKHKEALRELMKFYQLEQIAKRKYMN